jgi:hypothetical protein
MDIKCERKFEDRSTNGEHYYRRSMPMDMKKKRR